MSMYPWDYLNYHARAVTHLEQPSFTPQERAKLQALRTQVESCSVDIELDLDERRLRFARWLVDHGKLSEGVSY